MGKSLHQTCNICTIAQVFHVYCTSISHLIYISHKAQLTTIMNPLRFLLLAAAFATISASRSISAKLAIVDEHEVEDDTVTSRSLLEVGRGGGMERGWYDVNDNMRGSKPGNVMFDGTGGGTETANNCWKAKPKKVKWSSYLEQGVTTWKLLVQFKNIPENVFVKFPGDDHVEVVEVAPLWETQYWVASDFLPGTIYDGDAAGRFEGSVKKFTLSVRCRHEEEDLNAMSPIIIACDAATPENACGLTPAPSDDDGGAPTMSDDDGGVPSDDDGGAPTMMGDDDDDDAGSRIVSSRG